MPQPDFSGLNTMLPIAVQSIGELLMAKNFIESDLSQEITIVNGIKFQKKVGFINPMNDIGMKRTVGSCDFNTIDVTASTDEKTWTPLPWDTKSVYCADDYVNTIGEKALADGIDQFDMVNTELWTLIVNQLFPAIKRMYNRFIWMTDLDAAHTDDSPAGNISPAVDIKLVGMQDGLWKRAFAIWAAAPSQVVTIAANSEATYALQTSALTKALALEYANKLYFDMPSVIRQALDLGGFYYKCTSSFMDKLVQNFQGLALESMRVSLENGLKGIKIQGIAFVEDATQDHMIKKYNDNGTSLKYPHRVILMHKDNVLFGVPDTTKWGTFKMVFSEETDKMYIKMADKFDTMFLYDNLVMGAI